MASEAETGAVDGSSSLLLVIALAAAYFASLTLTGVVEGLGGSPDIILNTLAVSAMLALAAASYAGRTATLTGFLAAGRDMGPILTAMAVAASWGVFGAFTVFTGLVYVHGFDALLPVSALIAGLVLMLALVTPFIHRSGAMTLPEFLGQRFGIVVRMVAALLVVLTAGPLLIANLAVASDLAASVFRLDHAIATGGLAAVVALLMLPGGMRSALWAGAFQYVVIVTIFLLPVGVATWTRFLNPIPHVGYGLGLPDLDRLEAGLAESGLVDFETFRPFLRPNLDIDPLNWGLIALVIAAGTAAMPQLSQRFAAVPAVHGSRRAVAWTALFALVILAAMPAYAAIMRLEMTRLVAADQPASAAPDWLVRLSETDAVRIHGVSMAMFDLVRGVAPDASADPVTQLTALSAADPALGGAYASLPDEVRLAMADAARSLPAGASHDLVVAAFRATVLPAAADAVEGDGRLSFSAIEMDVDAVALAFPAFAGQSQTVTAGLVTGALLAALASLFALALTVASAISHDVAGPIVGRRMSPNVEVAVARGTLLAVSAAAAAIVIGFESLDLALLAITAVSVAAAGLLPMLIAAVWSRRTSPLSVLAGLIAGAAVSVYYVLGTGQYAVTFAETWAWLSNADAETVASFEDAMAAWLAAPDGPGREDAYAAVRDMARGTLVRPGLANWFGIAPAASAVLGLPVALLVSTVLGLALARRSTGTDAFLARIHGEPDVHDAVDENAGA